MKIKAKISVILLLLFPIVLPVKAASNFTPDFNNLFLIVTLLSIFVALPVIGAWIYLMWRFRLSNETERKPIGESTSRKLEMGWTILATLIIIVLMIVSYPPLLDSIHNQDQLLQDTGDSSFQEVIVEGSASWQWIFHYNGSIYGPQNTTDGYARLPLKTDTPYKFILWASGNWIHSFYVRGLGFKEDVVPGTNNTISTVISDPGDYLVLCAEFCGPGHPQMRAHIVVEAK